jgi:CrcB protein
VTALLVALGAAVGAPLRFFVAHHLDRIDASHPDRNWPRGTLLVNLVGSTVLGFCAARSLDGSALALVGTGFCGGLTTYSAFAVQVHDAGRLGGAAYAAASIVLGVAAAALGFVLGQALT